jgi:WXG100 family type VII secretion target
MASVDGTIRFDPERIAAAAADLNKQQQHFGQITAAIKQKAESLQSVWEGEAAESYQAAGNELDKTSAVIAEGFETLGQDLQNASGIYRNSEAGAKAAMEALPTDVFG